MVLSTLVYSGITVFNDPRWSCQCSSQLLHIVLGDGALSSWVIIPRGGWVHALQDQVLVTVYACASAAPSQPKHRGMGTVWMYLQLHLDVGTGPRSPPLGFDCCYSDGSQVACHAIDAELASVTEL
jgi:hypothetical protein